MTIIITIIVIILLGYLVYMSMHTKLPNEPVIIPPQESSVYFFGKIIPENKQIIYPEPYDGGVQMRTVIIPLHDSRYIIANFEWTLLPITNKATQAETVYLFENDTFVKIPSQLELYGNDVRGSILIDGKQESLNVSDSEFVEYDNTSRMRGRDLLNRIPLRGFTLTE